MISFWISVVPPKMVWTRLSAKAQGYRVLVHVAVAAVQLDAAIEDAVAQLGVPPLDHGCLLGGELALVVLHDGAVGECPGDGELGGHLGQGEPAVLDLANRPPE